MYDKDPWPPFFPRADNALWEVLYSAGVTLKPADLYGKFDNLFELYYAKREPELEEPTTFTVLEELLRQKGYRLPDTTISTALRAMYAVTQSNWYPETDAAPTLEILRSEGFRIGFVSNGADDENTQVLIDKAGLRKYAEFIISSAALGLRKPHRAIFEAALDYFQLKPDETVMVGDTLEADVLGANRMGMASIWITRRAQVDPDQENSIKPSLTVDTLSEIPDRLSELG